MTSLIFIDTNIYLDFYSTVQPQLQKLLPTLVQLRDQIVVTEQILEEVKRNAVRKLGESLVEAAGKAPIPSVTLPEHLAVAGDMSFADWNANRKKLREDGGTLNSDLAAHIVTMLTAVQDGKDSVSAQLGAVFAGVRHTSDIALAAARRRRERGNPPGKQSDPLGDQLSWEVLLEACQPGDDIWLVSRDGDYGFRHKGALYLSSLLREELASRTDGGNVHAFDELATALKHYSTVVGPPPASLPSDTELAAIVEEAQIVHPTRTASSRFFGAPPEVCPRCGVPDRFTGGSAHPSRFGGWSYFFLCTACGLMLDSGEPYDD